MPNLRVIGVCELLDAQSESDRCLCVCVCVCVCVCEAELELCGHIGLNTLKVCTTSVTGGQWSVSVCVCVCVCVCAPTHFVTQFYL